ncbi:alpha-L-fucosidase [Halocatena marina]|uniref:alpha-L-fucosidase n=2 Tax=Halocatena marina TaxID=2934937 RepID=A0ABD5YV01_9EURY
MNAKHRELIRKYDPDLLWFDVPKAEGKHLHAQELIADYYNRAAEQNKEVAVNDRASTDTIGPTIDVENNESEDTHGDFITPEYATFDEIRDEPWEGTRGIGHSFGYNAAEGEDDHLSRKELIHSFVDIVSKNGNLLINVGPKADGTIPEIQKNRLQALGNWLDVNGEAIFESRPWTIAEDDKSDTAVRYTHRSGVLYAIALDWPGDTLSLSVPAHADLAEAPDVTLLTGDGKRSLTATLVDDQLAIELPERPDHDHAYAVRIDGIENTR